MVTIRRGTSSSSGSATSDPRNDDVLHWSSTTWSRGCGPALGRTMQHRSFLLEVTPDLFRPKPFARRGIRIVRATVRQQARCRALWIEVGRGFWTARSRWTPARWQRHLRDGNVSFWIAATGGEDVGFFELVVKRRGVKLEGFGLMPAWRARGLGAGFLSAATKTAFGLGATRVGCTRRRTTTQTRCPTTRREGTASAEKRDLRNPMPPPDPKTGFASLPRSTPRIRSSRSRLGGSRSRRPG